MGGDQSAADLYIYYIYIYIYVQLYTGSSWWFMKHVDWGSWFQLHSPIQMVSHLFRVFLVIYETRGLWFLISATFSNTDGFPSFILFRYPVLLKAVNCFQFQETTALVINIKICFLVVGIMRIVNISKCISQYGWWLLGFHQYSSILFTIQLYISTAKKKAKQRTVIIFPPQFKVNGSINE